MIFAALGFFSLAVILGLYLISFILTNKDTPKIVVMIHGSVALIGIIMLIVYPFLYTPAPITSLILFVLAACGGITMVYKGLHGKVPKWLALGHGATAILAFILLVLFIYK